MKMIKGVIFLTTILVLYSCDTWTHTFVQNNKSYPIIIELIYDSSIVQIDTMKIEYRKYHNMDPILKTNCCMRFITNNSVPDANGVICNTLFTVSKERWKNINCTIDSADYSYESTYCTTIDTLPEGKIRINHTIGPNGVFHIGMALGKGPSTYYDELHIKWQNDNRFDTIKYNRIDLKGRNTILGMTQKAKNCYMIKIN